MLELKSIPKNIKMFPGVTEKQYFQNDETKEFWFHATSACKVLGYSNVTSAIALHCDDDEKLMEILNGKATWFVSEAGFYGLAMGAKTKEAKEFKRWLKHDVLPKLRASDRPLDVASLDQTRKEMQSNFEGLLAAKQYQLDSLTRSLTAQPQLQPEGEFLDLLRTPPESKYPYSIDELQAASGIACKKYLSNAIKASFKANEDFQDFRWGDGKSTVKRVSKECYLIMMLVLRSYRGIDLLAMPSLICIERDRYYEANQKKAVNKRIQHYCPGQLDLF